jgi:hypothetical protein
MRQIEKNRLIRMIAHFKNIFFCFLLVLFYSCDTSNYVDYNIINSTSLPIKVVYSTKIYQDSITKDTIVFVQPNQKETIATRGLLASGVFNPEAGLDTISEFAKLLLYQNDTIPTTVDLKKSGYWNYNKISEHHGELILNVYDSYFQ